MSAAKVPAAPHVHVFDAWSYRYPRSALSRGYERRYCACGSYQTRRVAAEGEPAEAKAKP